MPCWLFYIPTYRYYLTETPSSLSGCSAEVGQKVLLINKTFSLNPRKTLTCGVFVTIISLKLPLRFKRFAVKMTLKLAT